MEALFGAPIQLVGLASQLRGLRALRPAFGVVRIDLVLQRAQREMRGVQRGLLLRHGGIVLGARVAGARGQGGDLGVEPLDLRAALVVPGIGQGLRKLGGGGRRAHDRQGADEYLPARERAVAGLLGPVVDHLAAAVAPPAVAVVQGIDHQDAARPLEAQASGIIAQRGILGGHPGVARGIGRQDGERGGGGGGHGVGSFWKLRLSSSMVQVGHADPAQSENVATILMSAARGRWHSVCPSTPAR